MAFSKDGTITLTKEEGSEVVDRMENTLLELSKKEAIQLRGMSARGVALGMFIEILNVANPEGRSTKDVDSIN